MTYEKDPFDFEIIPDFAMQPAREAEEYNNTHTPGKAIERFDTSAYDKVLHPIKKAPNAEEVQPVIIPKDNIMPDVSAIAEASEETDPKEVIKPDDILEAAEALKPEEDEETAEVLKPIEIPETEEVKESLEAVDDEEPAEEAGIYNEPDTTEVFSPKHVFPIKKPVVPIPVPVPKQAPVKTAPVIGSVLSSKLKLVDIKKKPQVRVYIEEDILVPDVKPDLARIISMDGKIKLSEKEIHTSQSENEAIRIIGDLIIQTLYIPESNGDGDGLISIESRIPFKNETELKTGPYSDLVIYPSIESIDYTVINERKFKIKVTAALGIREYSNVDMEVFEGIQGEEVQMLKQKIQLTDVALRKTETAEIKEELMLKDNMPEILKILKYDVNVVENHKQITKEKAVINASVYCNIMYLGKEDSGEADSEEMEGTSAGAVPVLYQGKTEFTQFIKLDGDSSSAGQNPAGSKVSFQISSLNLAAKEDGSGKRNIFELDMSVDTGLELYKNIQKEIVTDAYHHLKDIQYDTDELNLMALNGSGVAEISVREIINIPEKYGNVDKVAYISGRVSERSSTIEQSKSIVEGNIAINIICIPADGKKAAFSINQDIPFRSAMEIPGISPVMTADNDIVLKELWFDKINNRQIEVNAGLILNTAISNQESHQLVKNISFTESAKNENINPGIILYISRAGDNIWKVAKKFRTTIDEVKKVNDIDFGKEIKPGTKLLIVAKNH